MFSKISSGPFTGMVYKYGEYKFTKPQTEEDEPKVQYEFNVLHIPEEITKAQYPDEMKDSFEHLLAEILIDVVMKQIDESVRVDHDDTNGKGDIDESFERRAFCEFDNPVSEE